jgi:hypothetical protein
MMPKRTTLTPRALTAAHGRAGRVRLAIDFDDRTLILVNAVALRAP